MAIWSPTWTEFLAAVAAKNDRDAVRLNTIDLDGKPSVITLKLDLEFWPTYELRRNEGVLGADRPFRRARRTTYQARS